MSSPRLVTGEDGKIGIELPGGVVTAYRIPDELTDEALLRRDLAWYRLWVPGRFPIPFVSGSIVDASEDTRYPRYIFSVCDTVHHTMGKPEALLCGANQTSGTKSAAQLNYIHGIEQAGLLSVEERVVVLAGLAHIVFVTGA